MSDSLSTKYRAAGAIVILLSVMLAWVLLMRFDEQNAQHVVSQPIPPKVEVETFVIPKAPLDIERKISTEEIADAEQHDLQSGQPNVKVNEAVTDPENTLRAQSLFASVNDNNNIKAWVLQVASFQDKSNAKKLQETLLENGYPAYVKVFTVHDELIFRVLVGPKLSYERAQSLSKKIVSEHQLRSLIMEYKPGFSE